MSQIFIRSGSVLNRSVCVLVNLVEEQVVRFIFFVALANNICRESFTIVFDWLVICEVINTPCTLKFSADCQRLEKLST